MLKILSSPPLFLVGSIRHKEDSIYLSGTCLKKEKSVYPKDQIENFSSKRHMKHGPFWKVDKTLSLLKEKKNCPI